MKFILIGGYPRKAPDGGKALCEEIVKGFKEPVKILDCLFARPEEIWEQSHAQDKDFFDKNLPNFKFEIIQAGPKKFVEQIKWSDVVYIRGGSAEKLLVEFLLVRT